MASSQLIPSIWQRADELLLRVRVSPSAARTAVAGVYGERLKISIDAPPEDGRANRRLIAAFADWLNLRREDVSIKSGHSSRNKVVAFTGVEEAELRNRLGQLLNNGCLAEGDWLGGSQGSEEPAS